MKEKVKFVGIDSFNRPIFRSIQYPRNFYGSLDKLFSVNHGAGHVKLRVKEEDLCFFGNSFGCEPEGTAVSNLEIVWE